LPSHLALSFYYNLFFIYKVLENHDITTAFVTDYRLNSKKIWKYFECRGHGEASRLKWGQK